MSWSHLEEERERGVGRAVGAGRGERAAVRERERAEHALERVLALSEEPGDANYKQVIFLCKQVISDLALLYKSFFGVGKL